MFEVLKFSVCVCVCVWTLAHARSLQLVAFRTDAAVGTQLVHALPLTHVRGHETLVHI